MKRITIILAIVMFIVLGVKCTIYMNRPVSPVKPLNPTVQANQQLTIYSGKKVASVDVKALFERVDIFNAQLAFPTNIRYGDSINDSYVWTATTDINITSKDMIADNGYFEVVMEDQLPQGMHDGFLDTITIRPYKMEYILTPTEPLVSGE